MNNKEYVQRVHSLKEVIATIGRLAEKKLPKAKTEAEYAFLLGHINMAAAISYACAMHDNQIEINLNYDGCKKAYEAVNKKEETIHQISLEELLPEIFAAIDKKIARKNKQSDQPKSKKE